MQLDIKWRQLSPVRIHGESEAAIVLIERSLDFYDYPIRYIVISRACCPPGIARLMFQGYAETTALAKECVQRAFTGEVAASSPASS